ncbi:TBC1 domain family member 20 [Seminavis robusta]|uniref:TBC1 domain family member 20 n=1 Tax=Seminavis robusta TaxID=568900 RepID=A0A9N8HQD7_9STRA|nr:TBC1 domain family member 20 [Seminavis robusta]|eukprot:Sro975_g226780.1 TBC1 domain family member 20 (485) ;mRNA; r:17147-18788
MRSDSSNNSNSVQDVRMDKENRIRHLLNRQGSTWQLREMALTRGGLVNAELRQQIWPLLAGLEDDKVPSWMETTAQLFEPTTEVYCEAEDRERDLIRRDVGRSVLFHHSCPSPNSVMAPDDSSVALSIKSNPEYTTSTLASVLTATISAPLEDGDKPHYYQGLHDIGGVLLHNLDYNEIFCTAILRKLCQTHLRDCARETFIDLQHFLNACLLPVVGMIDPPVHETLLLSGVPLLSTVLPWLLTWFTHSIHDEQDSSRLVDAFMASHPLLPFYVSIALLVHRKLRMDILTTELDDPSSMHFCIQNLPSRIKSDWSHENSGLYLSTQELIETALSIMKQVPPKTLLNLVNDPGLAERMVLLQSPPVIVAPSSCTAETCSRAKMASGVSVYMATQQPDVVGKWLRPFGPPPCPFPPPSPTAQPTRRPTTQLRRIRNRLRQVRRLLPKTREGWIFFAYFSFIFLYSLYDFIHYSWVLFATRLATRAH